MNTEIRLSSPNDSIQSYSNNKNEEYSDKIAKQRVKKLKHQNEQHLASQSKDNISAREQKKIDQYAKLFHQQDLVSYSTNLKAERKKQKKIKINHRVKEQELQETKEIMIELKFPNEDKVIIDNQPVEELQKIQQDDGMCESPKIQSEILKRDMADQNTEEFLFNQDLNENIVSAQVIQSKQEIKIQKEEENSVSFRLQMNPRVKMQEKNKLFLYLSECQDKCQSTMQKLASVAPQLYSPPRNVNKQPQEHSNLFPINSEVFYETQILTSNLVGKFKSYGDSIKIIGPEQREFICKYVDKKNLRSILRDSRMQIFKRGADKSTQNIQGFNKLIPKKY